MKSLKAYQPHHQKNPSKAIDTKSNEYNADDEDLSDCLAVLVRENKETRPHRSRCPRCGSRSKVNSQFPYCMDCNWDSLHDPSWSHE